MHNDKESPFTLTLVEADLSLQVLQFSGREGLNQPYRFEIKVIGLAPAMNLERLLQQPAFLSLGDDQGFHGILHSASREHRGLHRIGYRLELVPHLQNLEQQSARRVFHRLSVPAILRQLFEEHALPEHSYRFELATGHYPVRPFCIQYEESDLALLHRLCEEEGIHYHFEHRRDGHVLVLADDSLSFPQEPVLTPFHDNPLDEPAFAAIHELFQRHDSPQILPQTQAQDRSSAAASFGAANHPLTDKPASNTRLATGPLHRDQRSRRSLERLRCQHRQVHGQSDQPGLLSGRIVQVEHHPVSSFNDQWLLTEIQHQGQQPSILADEPFESFSYGNRFSAIPWSTVFRPALKQPRPSIPGYQLARVLGEPGQAAMLDKLGRIQVSLWPGSDAHDADGIWLPVAVAASGLPTAGSEVFISFLDSDPDRPVICAVSNIQNSPPAHSPTPRGDTRLLFDWLVNRPDTP
ncbi:type VI secretion system Vgr family protein [Pseudomonas nunensis]|uniref:Type VI secretion system tip protein VgrG n=1 Tax=Pseudomonas nunensis TaxID=2961896 RepID=A0ABY5EK69_9PSED|nr:type VI secretion system tip protein TssI/VgrG [Pseudomonas nunensis]KPN87338.1 type IV secretion protein Rhs [Pseudomonas nunensis]MCL5228383.1 type VI secretion system tip protein VgrG [Pseudomonas nunensis]UTO15939.1 type VI secretion system tip protein VgrG [Pseudomonas nunensis]